MEEIWLGYSGAKPIVQGNLVGFALALLREMAPNLTRAELERELLAGIVEGIEKAEARLPQMHAEMRAAIADLRVLSFSEIFDNILMWAHYAQRGGPGF